MAQILGLGVHYFSGEFNWPVMFIFNFGHCHSHNNSMQYSVTELSVTQQGQDRIEGKTRYLTSSF